MATTIKIEFSGHEVWKPYIGESKDGYLRILHVKGEPSLMKIEASIDLQSWPSFSLDKSNVYIKVLEGKRVLRELHLVALALKITKCQEGHFFEAVVPSVDIKDHFGSFHEFES